MRRRYDTPTDGGSITGVHWNVGWSVSTGSPEPGKTSCGASGSAMVNVAQSSASWIRCGVSTRAHTSYLPSGSTPDRTAALMSAVSARPTSHTVRSAAVYETVSTPFTKYDGLRLRPTSPSKP
ncbi:MAG TPA: hypothetical protein VK966_10095 [Longimicrobiales bacterium]|nr:hypothetical protein [Longimicrobiales bacterium]